MKQTIIKKAKEFVGSQGLSISQPRVAEVMIIVGAQIGAKETIKYALDALCLTCYESGDCNREQCDRYNKVKDYLEKKTKL